MSLPPVWRSISSSATFAGDPARVPFLTNQSVSFLVWLPFLLPLVLVIAAYTTSCGHLPACVLCAAVLLSMPMSYARSCLIQSVARCVSCAVPVCLPIPPSGDILGGGQEGAGPLWYNFYPPFIPLFFR